MELKEKAGIGGQELMEMNPTALKDDNAHSVTHLLVKCGPSSLVSFGCQEARVAAVAHQSHFLAQG